MRFEKLQWLFPVAVTLHNTEEALTMPRWIATHATRVPLHPASTKLWLGWLGLTAAAFGITYLSARKGKESVWAYLLFGYCAAMLANVFIPHVPATVAFGGYTPGVITAVLVNLPVMILLMARALGERWVSNGKAAAYAVLVPVGIGGAIVLLFARR
jgi:hypothetical protein